MAAESFVRPRRIAMLSGPRNISTTMMRAFGSRPDTVVADEPFYACYLAATGAPHPMRAETLAAQSSDWEEVLRQLATRPDKTERLSFEKHIAYHFDCAPASLNLLEGAQTFHLIRDPRAMVASFSDKYDDVTPITESYRLQRRLHEQAPSPVIDATDILKDPKSALSALCAALDIPFYEEMLSWPPGPHECDGAWGPHWYEAVWSSTGFRAYAEKPIRLSEALEKLAQVCMPDFEYLYERRLSF